MIRIASDTSTLYSIEEGRSNNIEIAPLSVTINEKSYREFEEIQAEEFIDIIHEGYLPISSQPSIGEVLNIFDKYPEDEIINISMADGLSGTYNTACAAREMAKNPERISVVNSKTLCGPHRYLVNLAVKLIETGKTRLEILDIINSLMETSSSFLMPKDFGYLVRGGRLTPFMGHIGGLVKLVPVLKLTNNGQLGKFSIKRAFRKAVDGISKVLISDGVDDTYKIYISHANIAVLADKAKEIILSHIPNGDVEILKLSPAFITQGGPECVAIQVIKRHPLY